jgi:ABC-type transport system involved in cytochrome bd biosynthesis fused ATPase/permease subunit
VLDEATAGIDRATEDALKSILQNVLTSDTEQLPCLLMICHKRELAIGLCNKVLIMQDGRVHTIEPM